MNSMEKRKSKPLESNLENDEIEKNYENETEVNSNGKSTDPSKSIFEKFTEKIKTFLENAE